MIKLFVFAFVWLVEALILAYYYCLDAWIACQITWGAVNYPDGLPLPAIINTFKFM